MNFFQYNIKEVIIKKFNNILNKMYLKRKINILILLIIIVIIVVSVVITNRRSCDVEFDNFLVENQISIDDNKDDNNKIKVHIDGCVNKPGIIEIDEGSRIADAIDLVGGLTSDASTKNINLAYELQDGEKIYIPSKEESHNNEETIQVVSMGNTQSSSNGKININTASIDELQTISGIGKSTAQKIIDYRNENGKFKKIEELKEITGIGDRKYDIIKEQVTV